MSFNVEFFLNCIVKMLDNIPLVLEITALTFVFALILAVPIAFIRIYKVKVIGPLADFYVSFIRGTPLVLHIFIILYGLPRLVDLAVNAFGLPFESKDISTLAMFLVAFSINSGAYLSEVVRSGILSVDKGEVEAAYSIGMATPRVMSRVIVPQALSTSLPNICNTLIGLLEGSSMATFVGVSELTTEAYILGGNNWLYFEAFCAAGAIYWILAIIIEQGMALIERLLMQRGAVAAFGKPEANANAQI